MTRGDLEKAQKLGDKASAKGMEALAALPASSEINPNTIDDLKKQNMHQLADSLANVKRMLDSADFTLNMMAGFTSMASNFGNTGKSANEGAAAIQNAIASKPRTTPTTYQTYKAPRAFMAAPLQAAPIQWVPSSYFNWQQPLNNNWQSGKGYSFLQYY